MRLSLLILLVLVVAAAVVSGQDLQSRRQKARARFRALANAARSGDKEAQQILKSRRRSRTRQQEETKSAAAPREQLFPNAQPAPVEEQTPAPTPGRLRIPVRRTRVRIPRPVAPEPTTFHPAAVFPPTPAPAPFTPEPRVFEEVTDPVTEAPVFDVFPTEPPTEAPVFHNVIANTPSPARSLIRGRSQRPTPSIPRVVRPRPVVQEPEQPAPVIQRTFRPAPVVQRPARPLSRGSDFDLEPHRAINSGLEVDSRSEQIFTRRGDRTTETPVETIRRYSYFDEEGNYIFGYEAADGSFKEEKRGLDCIVTGKYGYVDPDGIRREFSYTSGNRCDPNAVVDPDLQEVPELPPNDQFLQQTIEQPLSEAELNELNFNRRRRPVQPPQPQTLAQRPQRQRTRQQVQHTRVSDTRRQQPQPLPAVLPVTQTSRRAEPLDVTPAPRPRFTTPPSFNQFKTPSFARPQTERVQEQPSVQQIATPTTQPPRVVLTNPPPRIVNTPAPRLFTQRPKPQPATFDFDKEFNNLFSHFGASPQTSQRQFFTAPTQPPTRPTSAPITKPAAPLTTKATPPPTTKRLPPPTPSFSPVAAAPPAPTQVSSTLGGAPQLVFDSATGTFKTVHVKAPPRPSVSTPVHNPFRAPTSSPAVGVPLPPPNKPARFNPLPPVPTGGLVINQQGRSPATDEFNKFFSQFNLNFR